MSNKTEVIRYNNIDLDVSMDYMHLYSVSADGTMKTVAARLIVDASNSSLAGRYLESSKAVDIDDKQLGTVNGSSEIKLYTLGKFKNHGNFIKYKEALNCQKDFLYDRKSAIEAEIQKINNNIEKLEIQEFSASSSWENLAEKWFDFKPLAKNGKVATYQVDMLNAMLDDEHKVVVIRHGRQIGSSYMQLLAMKIIAKMRKGKTVVHISPDEMSCARTGEKFSSNFAIGNGMFLFRSAASVLNNMKLKNNGIRDIVINADYIFCEDFTLYQDLRDFLAEVILKTKAKIILSGNPMGTNEKLIQNIENMPGVKKLYIPTPLNPGYTDEDDEKHKSSLSEQTYRRMILALD